MPGDEDEDVCVYKYGVCAYMGCAVYMRNTEVQKYIALQMVTTLCPFSTEPHNPSIYIHTALQKIWVHYWRQFGIIMVQSGQLCQGLYLVD